MALPLADIGALFMHREALLGRGMAVLAAWVLLNLIGSGYCLAHADRRHAAFYFHGLNVLCNLVNAGLAGGAFCACISTRPPASTRPSC